jgi:hypothetical protein
MTDLTQIPVSPLSEHFAHNIFGKTVSYDIQPYEHGTGTIVGIKTREIKIKTWVPGYGTSWVTYEVFDLELELTSGSHQGAFWGGVAVGKSRDLAGTRRFVNGVRRPQLGEAVFDNRTIVQATCG